MLLFPRARYHRFPQHRGPSAPHALTKAMHIVRGASFKGQGPHTEKLGATRNQAGTTLSSIRLQQGMPETLHLCKKNPAGSCYHAQVYTSLHSMWGHSTNYCVEHVGVCDHESDRHTCTHTYISVKIFVYKMYICVYLFIYLSICRICTSKYAQAYEYFVGQLPTETEAAMAP